MMMVVNTIWGEAEILGSGPGRTLYVRMLNWTPEQVEKMGGEKEAWILIGEHQCILNRIREDK